MVEGAIVVREYPRNDRNKVQEVSMGEEREQLSNPLPAASLGFAQVNCPSQHKEIMK
jgi:hypothetical protein